MTTLTQLVDEFKDSINQQVIAKYPPQYHPGRAQPTTLPLLRPPIGAQYHAIQALAQSLQSRRGTIVVGEMGTGKTYISLAAAQQAGAKTLCVICPPHLVRKWQQEIALTLPNARAAIVENLTELKNFRTQLDADRAQNQADGNSPENEPITVMICSRNSLKSGYFWKPALAINGANQFYSLALHQGGIHPLSVPSAADQPRDAEHTLRCPYCGARATRDGVPVEYLHQLPRGRRNCRQCREPLDPARQTHCPACRAPYPKPDPNDPNQNPNQNPAPARRRCTQCQPDHNAQSPRLPRIMRCPDCHAVPRLDDDQTAALGLPQLSETKTRCIQCGGALWTADGDRILKFPLHDYIRRYFPKKYFDIAIIDEAHEYKASRSEQGIAAGNLANLANRVVALTGTLMGGYASTLFYLMFRFSAEIRREFEFDANARWVDLYGFQRETRPIQGRARNNRAGRGRKDSNQSTVEIPGLHPSALLHLLENTIFLRLADVSDSLPPYSENVETVAMDQNDPHDPQYPHSQESGYFTLLARARRIIAANQDHAAIRTYNEKLLAYPDSCWRGEELKPEYPDEPPEILVPPTQPDRVYPKEQRLAQLVAEQQQRGRRCLIYVYHTATRDITARVQKILSDAGLHAIILKSNSPNTKERAAWIESAIERENPDAMICNPRLVQTGLDLIQFPTIIWYETDYSVYTTMQASHRSWRIGQDQPVEVYFLAYAGTVQTDALRLIARKAQTANAVEGELPQDGLPVWQDQNESMNYVLARSIMEGQDADSENLETIFAKARQQARQGEEFLVRQLPATEISGTAPAPAAIADPTASPAWTDHFTAGWQPAPRPKRRAPAAGTTEPTRPDAPEPTELFPDTRFVQARLDLPEPENAPQDPNRDQNQNAPPQRYARPRHANPAPRLF